VLQLSDLALAPPTPFVEELKIDLDVRRVLNSFQSAENRSVRLVLLGAQGSGKKTVCAGGQQSGHLYRCSMLCGLA
jgi:hypothetical protein